jgi:hypothetical protein
MKSGKLTHPLGPVKQMRGAASQPAPVSPVVQAVNALKPTTKLAALAAQASKTTQRQP